MLRILGSPRKMCGGFTRREAMHIGGLSALGLHLSQILAAEETNSTGQAGLKNGKAKACILLFPYGSPPQHETFDPKPDAPSEIQGELKAIPTSVPGIQIGEMLPEIAKVVDRLTIVRSMSHPYPVHGVAYATSGIPTYTPALEVNPRDPRHWPYIGSMVDYAIQQDRETPSKIPQNVALPWKMNSQNGGVATAGPYAAFLGAGYDPVVASFQGKASAKVKKDLKNGKIWEGEDPFAGVKPNCFFSVGDPGAQGGLTLDRLDRRRSLLEQLDRQRARIDSRSVSQFNRHQEMALSVLTSPRMRKALDPRREPLPLRERYGMTLFGQSCLTARRLVELGSRFVTVFWDEVGGVNLDWDTHWGHYPRLKERLLPGFDRSFSALILDLEARGMLDETLVVWMSEHGRTPRLNKSKGGGRDHWSRAYSIVLAGGGIARGKVVGQTDRIAGDVSHVPISPKDILATILHLLGMDPHGTIPDRLGRPMPMAGEGKVREDLF